MTNDQGAGAAFTVTLPAGDAGIFPTAYTLKHGNAGTQYSLRHWVLEAGRDRGGTDRNNVTETDWVLLSEHEGDGSLDGGFAHHTWALAGHRLGAGNAVCGNLGFYLLAVVPCLPRSIAAIPPRPRDVPSLVLVPRDAVPAFVSIKVRTAYLCVRRRSRGRRRPIHPVPCSDDGAKQLGRGDPQPVLRWL